ncbi:response regulator transcription factor [Xanthomonas campestris pv. phormiicola]|nr:response regulator transcription factor [Xanthomonas campestris pv. phormiicola]UYC17853.1 response regulator transcription factor [Xanthomonas campestris pv. phormiicola]
MRVAILEDTVSQALALANWLDKAGYPNVVRHDGNSFVKLLEMERVDMLLLDWEVPGRNGIEVLRWVREQHACKLPVIMLSNHEGEDSIVHGLENGADDYLVKPTGERELIARVRAQERKYYPESLRGEWVVSGNYTLNVSARSVKLCNNGVSRVVHLPAREFTLALHLFRNVGRIVSKNELIQTIWGKVDSKYDATLATYISKLRNSLELRAKNGMVVSTVYNHGYRLEVLPNARRRVGSESQPVTCTPGTMRWS